MADNIIDINDKRPHLTGTAHCIVCNHEWQAVMPVGSIWAECPACSCMRGVMKHYIGQPETPIFQCNHCETHVFYILPYGAKCLGCGFTHKMEVFYGTTNGS